MTFRGSGIFVFQQSFSNLVEGDEFWDADYGLMVWHDNRWISEDEYKLIQLSYAQAS